jgi:hypothetical protein
MTCREPDCVWIVEAQSADERRFVWAFPVREYAFHAMQQGERLIPSLRWSITRVPEPEKNVLELALREIKLMKRSIEGAT